MNAYVIIGQRHGSSGIELIGNPIPAAEARDTFMAFRTKRSDPDFQSVWLCRLDAERQERYAPEPAVPQAETKKSKRAN